MSNQITVLEEKIIAAKKAGLQFNLIPPGQGLPAVPIGTMNVLQTWTNQEFEQALDLAVERMNKNTYLAILNKHIQR